MPIQNALEIAEKLPPISGADLLLREVANLRKPDVQTLAPIATEMVKQNIDLIANVVSKLPDQMFPLDETKMPLLKLAGIKSIEKHGGTYTVETDKPTSWPLNKPPLKSIDFDKKFSFQIGTDPKTGTATIDHITGINAHARVMGYDVNVPVHSIDHAKQGEAKFHVDAGMPLGLPGTIKADVSIDNQNHVNVDHPAIKIGDNTFNIPAHF